MTEEQEMLIEIRALIAQQPPEMQQKIRECEEKIRALLQEYGECGGFAIVLVGAELTSKDSESAN